MEKVKRTPASLKKDGGDIFAWRSSTRAGIFDNTVVTISDVNRPALQLLFRSTPFVPWDIFSIGTATSVASGRLLRLF